MAKVTPNTSTKPSTAPAAEQSKPEARPVPGIPGASTTVAADKPAKAKKERKKIERVVFPGLLDADGKRTVKLTCVDGRPEGYSTAKHLPLKRTDFADDASFFGMMAAHCAAKAEFFKKKAEESKKLGNVKDVKRAKQLLKAQEHLVKLRQQLEEQGINVDELLASQAAKPTETEAAK